MYDAQQKSPGLLCQGHGKENYIGEVLESIGILRGQVERKAPAGRRI